MWVEAQHQCLLELLSLVVAFDQARVVCFASSSSDLDWVIVFELDSPYADRVES